MRVLQVVDQRDCFRIKKTGCCGNGNLRGCAAANNINGVAIR